MMSTLYFLKYSKSCIRKSDCFLFQEGKASLCLPSIPLLQRALALTIWKALAPKSKGIGSFLICKVIFFIIILFFCITTSQHITESTYNILANYAHFSTLHKYNHISKASVALLVAQSYFSYPLH